MYGRSHFSTNAYFAKQLLTNLTFERFSRSFTRFNFPTWKFPHSAQASIYAPLSTKNLIVTYDYCAHYADLFLQVVVPGFVR